MGVRRTVALAAATREWALVLFWVTSYAPFLVGCALTHISGRRTGSDSAAGKRADRHGARSIG
ncbi:hypothetical protein [Streptomyces mirabilis]|uniref:hypothetical protein n=1 Tax=Streptomyces mirabilis TaxID=68239 RepID=UPI0033BDDB0B